MLSFDFKCNDCGHVFEAWVKDTKEKPECPECESAAVDKKPGLFRTTGGTGGEMGRMPKFFGGG